MSDPPDLSRLADIALPPSPPWWPPALGWWIIGAAILSASAMLAAIGLRRYRRSAYRRAALAELTAIGQVTDPASAAAVSAVLKRAALFAYPRTEVASLTGASWQAFLDRTAATNDFTTGPAAGLVHAALGGPARDGGAIVAAAQRWILQHGRES